MNQEPNEARMEDARRIGAANSAIFDEDESREAEEARQLIEELHTASGYDAAELEATLEAERSVLGTTAAKYLDPIDPEAMKEAKRGFQEALRSIPPAQKEAYLQVKARAEYLINLESPAERFLIAKQYNFWEAAAAFCQYWDLRKSVFGPEKFWKPLNLISGEDGALPPQVQQLVFQSGMFSVGQSSDECNRPIVIIDRRAASPEVLELVGAYRPLLGFYLIQTLSESTAVLQNGFVLLYFMEDPSEEDDSWNTIKQSREVTPTRHMRTSDAMRVLSSSSSILTKCRSVHFMAPWEESIWGQLSNVYLSVAEAFLGFRFRVHFIKNKTHAIQNLKAFGMSEMNLPMRYGGGTAADGKRWYHERVALETECYSRGHQTEQLADTIKNTEEKERARSLKIKRALERVDQYNRASMERRKRARLKKAVVDAHNEKVMLEKQHVFLQEKLKVVQQLVTFHEEDRSKIIRFIANELQSNASYSSVRKTMGDPTIAAEKIISKFLLLKGRGAETGDWQFGIPKNLTTAEQRISLDLACGLQRSQVDIRRETLTTITPPSLLEGDLDNHDDVALDAYFRNLGDYKKYLEKTKEHLAEDHSFLNSCSSVAEYTASMFDKYLQENRESLAKLYSDVFQFLTGKDGTEYLSGVTSPHSVAKRVLEKYVCWDGQQFYGPAVMEQYLTEDRESTIHMAVSSLSPDDLQGFRELLGLHSEADRSPVAQCLDWYSDAPLFVKIAGRLILFTPPSPQQVEAHQQELLRQAQAVLDDEAKRARMAEQEKQFEVSRRKYRSERKKMLKRL